MASLLTDLTGSVPAGAGAGDILCSGCSASELSGPGEGGVKSACAAAQLPAAGFAGCFSKLSAGSPLGCGSGDAKSAAAASIDPGAGAVLLTVGLGGRALFIQASPDADSGCFAPEVCSSSSMSKSCKSFSEYLPGGAARCIASAEYLVDP